MMRTTAKHPDITPIPVQLAETAFNACIFPHLSMPKRGPRCKIGYHRLFNLMLWVLYTGMPWKCLPIPKGLRARLTCTTPTSTERLPHGSMMGRSSRRSSPVWPISRTRRSSMYACCTATGPTPWLKKGGWHWVFGVQTPEGRESHRDHGQPWLCVGSPPRGARQ